MHTVKILKDMYVTEEMQHLVLCVSTQWKGKGCTEGLQKLFAASCSVL